MAVSLVQLEGTSYPSLMRKSSWRAQLVGNDPANDIAVLKIDAPANHRKG